MQTQSEQGVLQEEELVQLELWVHEGLEVSFQGHD